MPLLPIVSATRKLPDHSGEKRKRIALRRVFSKCLKDRQHLHCSRGPRVCGPAQRVCVYVCGPSRIRSQIPESRFSQVTIIACVLSNDRTEREAENERERAVIITSNVELSGWPCSNAQTNPLRRRQCQNTNPAWQMPDQTTRPISLHEKYSDENCFSEV